MRDGQTVRQSDGPWSRTRHAALVLAFLTALPPYRLTAQSLRVPIDTSTLPNGLQNDLPLIALPSFIARINAVSAAAVQRVARRYIDPDHFAIVVVGDRALIEAPIRALNEGPISVRDLWGREIR